jgi:hypothetical protein
VGEAMTKARGVHGGIACTCAMKHEWHQHRPAAPNGTVSWSWTVVWSCYVLLLNKVIPKKLGGLHKMVEK